MMIQISLQDVKQDRQEYRKELNHHYLLQKKI